MANRRNKYNAKKIEIDGHLFDSKKEANRYAELKILEKAGEITELELQKKFEVIPRQLGADGKVIERSACYIADFTYKDKEGNLVVEDVKGYRMSQAYNLFVIKRKLMLQVYGIRVLEL